MKARDLILLGAVGAGAAVVADRWLEGLVARGEGPDPVVRMAAPINAPIAAVWDEISNVERQPLWMSEMKAFRILTPGPIGVGTRGEADVRVFLIGIVDPVEISEFEPPVRFAIRHVGHFAGEGRITLEAIDTGRTLVHWEERLVPPIFPTLGQVLQKAILGGIFQADLERLREIVETSWAEATAPAVADAG